MTALPLHTITPREANPRRICSYCEADLGPAVGCTGHSHGICGDCLPLFFPAPAQLEHPMLRARALARIRLLEAEIQALDRRQLTQRALLDGLMQEWGAP